MSKKKLNLPQIDSKEDEITLIFGEDNLWTVAKLTHAEALAVCAEIERHLKFQDELRPLPVGPERNKVVDAFYVRSVEEVLGGDLSRLRKRARSPERESD